MFTEHVCTVIDGGRTAIHGIDFIGMDVRIVSMERYITKYIQKNLDKKIILLAGPRQAGKTTLSKMLGDDFNYDNVDDRLGLQERSLVFIQQWVFQLNQDLLK